MNKLSELRTSALARLRKIATGGVVALVLGGLLATGITVSASALEPDEALFGLTVTSDGEPVANARVEVLRPEGGKYVYEMSGDTDDAGYVNLTEGFDDYFPTLEVGVAYAVSVSKENSFDDEALTYSGGYLAGRSGSVVDDFTPEQAVVLSAGANNLAVELTTGAVVSGSVVDPDGEPVTSSAVATAYRKTTNLSTGGVAWDFEGSSYVDESGDYTITGLRAGDYVVGFNQSQNETWARTVYNLGLSSISAATPVAITRSAAGDIDGQFVGGQAITGTISVPAGESIFDAVFGYPLVSLFLSAANPDGTFDSADPDYANGVVNADGTFTTEQLVPGLYYLYVDSEIEGVSGEWYDNASSGANGQSIAAGSVTEPIELGTGFDLTINAKSGNAPLKNAYVRVEAVNGLNNFYSESFDTPANGKVIIDDLPAGDYTVTVEDYNDFDSVMRYATANGIGSTTPGLISAVEGSLTVGVTFPAPVYTAVTVVDPTGKPVVGAYVEAIAITDGVRDTTVPERSDNWGYTSKTGVVSLRVEPDTQYTLLASGNFATSYNQYLGGAVAYVEGNLADAKTFSSDDVSNLTFALAAAGKISGVVKSTAGKVVPGVDVEAFLFNGTDWISTGYGSTTKTGAYSISVKPGSYKVGFSTPRSPSQAFIGDYTYGITDFDTLATVYVPKAGVATVNKSLVAGGSLTGTVANAAGVVLPSAYVTPIRIDGDERTPMFAQANGTLKGVFTLVGLPSGTYALSVESDLVANPYTPSGPVATYVVTAGKITKVAAKILLPAASTQAKGTVSGNLSPAVNGVEGYVAFQSADGLYYRSAELTGDGAYTVDLAPGTYNYYASFQIEDGAAFRPVTGQINVAVGQNPLDLSAILLDPLTFEEAPIVFAPSGWSVGTTVYGGADWDQSRADATFQWLRDGLPIFGARDDSYLLKGGDLGSNISLRVTLDNGEYVGSVFHQSVLGTTDAHSVEAAAAIELDEFDLIADRTSPGGIARVSGFIPDGWTPTYTWNRNGEPILGQAASTYTFVAGDVDQNISASVTANRLGYTSTAAVETGYLTGTLGAAATNVKKPTVTAKAAAAGAVTYTATPGTWSIAGTTPVYTWLVDGNQIDTLGAAVTIPADLPKSSVVAVRVTATKAGLEASYPVEVVARKGTAYPEGSPSVVFDQLTEDPIGTEVIVGQKLVAYTQTSYPFGAPTYSYVWQRQTGTAWAAIAKATTPGYTVTTADLNKNLRVLVTVSSPYYASKVFTASAGKGVLDQALRFDRADSVSFTGTAAVSSTVTAVIAPQHNDNFAIAGAAVAYQWGTVSGDTFTPVAKATAAKFVVPANLVGKDLAVRVTATKAGYAPSVETSPRDVVTTGTIAVLTPVSYTGMVNEAIRVGAKLTVKPAVTDVTGTVRTYQWQSSLDGIEFIDIVGAKATTYLPTAANLGYQIRVIETINKAAHETVVSTLGQNGGEGSDNLWTVELGTTTVKIAPKVTTTAAAYTVVPGSAVPAAGSFTYTWIVAGEYVENNSPSLARNATNAGKIIEVRVDYQLDGYQTRWISLIAQKGVAPATLPFTISDPQVGVVSTFTPGSAEFPAGSQWMINVAYQWYAGTVAIKGATSWQYTPTAAQANKPISLKVTVSSATFATKVYSSAAKIVALGAGAENGVSAPTGPVAAGSVLTANVDDARVGYTVGYAWYRAVGEGAPVAIPKATTNKYTTLAADVNTYITLKVTYTRAGYATKSYTVGGAVVLPASGLGVIVKPTLTGSGAVDSPLTVTPGTWTLAPTLSYQWYRNDVEIPGAVTAKYAPLADHLGDTITVVVTAKRAGFFTAYVGTNDVKVINGAAPAIVGTAVPKITGTAKTCSTFAATTGTWNVDGLAYSYQWYLTTGTTAVAITGATASTYTSDSSALGAKVSVKVTATRDGYLVGSRDSVATAVLAAGLGCGAE